MRFAQPDAHHGSSVSRRSGCGRNSTGARADVQPTAHIPGNAGRGEVEAGRSARGYSGWIASNSELEPARSWRKIPIARNIKRRPLFAVG